ncbi:MAG: ABC transporter permease [Pseudomonadota bacterium]
MVPSPHMPIQFVRSTGAMVMREMVTSYGRSPGGYVWAVLEPVAAISLISVVFSLAFHAPSLGTSFVFFYATAYLPFMLFNDVVNKLTSALRYSRPLLAYPAVGFLDALMARFLLNLVTHLLVFCIVIAGIFAIIRPPAIIDIPIIFGALGMVAALSLGVGCLNCFLLTAFPVWERLWQIITRPLFIVSGILFVYEDVPAQFREWLWFNPLFHITGEMRRGFYANYEPGYVSPVFVYLTALICAVIGIFFLLRTYRDFLET